MELHANLKDVIGSFSQTGIENQSQECIVDRSLSENKNEYSVTANTFTNIAYLLTDTIFEILGTADFMQLISEGGLRECVYLSVPNPPIAAFGCCLDTDPIWVTGSSSQCFGHGVDAILETAAASTKRSPSART
jgi:hypothetical protein